MFKLSKSVQSMVSWFNFENILFKNSNTYKRDFIIEYIVQN